MSNTGLGRGLGSLIPNKNISQPKKVKEESKQVIQTSSEGEANVMATLETGERILQVEINKVSPNPMQPREVFNEREMEELVASVKKYGVLSPLIVTDKGAGEYELIAGERRLRASKLAELKTVPVIVREADEQEKLEIAIIENIQRKNLDPIEEAKSFKRLTDEFDLTQEEVGDRLGKSRPQVTNTLRLLTLPEEIKKALQEGKISFGHAKVILGAGTPQDQLNLYRKILVNNLTVREAEGIVGPKRTKKILEKEPKDPRLIPMEKMLRDSLSTKVSIAKKGSKGKISIEFYSEDDLDALIQKLA